MRPASATEGKTRTLRVQADGPGSSGASHAGHPGFAVRNQTSALLPGSVLRRVEASANTFVRGLICYLVLSFAVCTVMPVDYFLISAGVAVAWADRIAAAVALGIPIAWIVLDGTIAHATVGMRKRDLIFRTIEGNVVTRPHAAVRIVAGILLLPALPVSVLVAWRNPLRRTLADLICSTVVCDSTPTATERLRCRTCGYLLIGLDRARCPECGSAFSTNGGSQPKAEERECGKRE